MGAAEWVVVIEIGPAQPGRAIDPAGLGRLVELIPDPQPVTPEGDDVVALQVYVDAPDEAAALDMASADVRAALSKEGIGDLRFVRAEVMTPEEFERQSAMGIRDQVEPLQPHLRAVTDDASPTGWI